MSRKTKSQGNRQQGILGLMPAPNIVRVNQTKTTILNEAEKTLAEPRAPSGRLAHRVVGVEAVPPVEWPEAKRRLHGNVELSLLQDPNLRHLTVLPPGCLKVVVEVEHSIAR